MTRRECLLWLTSLGVSALVSGPGVMRSAAAPSGPPGMDEANRNTLLNLYQRYAENKGFQGKIAELLGFGTGQTMSVVQLVLTRDKTQWAFGHFAIAPEDYYFGHSIKDSGSAAKFFRVDREFRLVGDVVAWRDGSAVRMSSAESAAVHAQQMKEWLPRIEDLVSQAFLNRWK